MAIIEISMCHRGHKKPENVPYVSVSKVDLKDRKTRITVFISKSAMKDLRWVTGDRVKVAFDDESFLLTLTRTVGSNGFSLCGRQHRKAVIGESIPAIIRFNATGIIKPVNYTGLDKDDCVIDGTSITFVMPGQS